VQGAPDDAPDVVFPQHGRIEMMGERHGQFTPGQT
jgi:hypothetical protein